MREYKRRIGLAAVTLLLTAAPSLVMAEIACRIEMLTVGSPAASRLDAIDACGAEQERAAFPYLIKIATKADSPGDERMAAINALGLLRDARATLALIKILERDMDERRGFAMVAIPALGLIGDARATQILLQALRKRDDHWLGREAAAVALGRIGDPAASHDLIAACWMADTRDEAIAALAQMATPHAAEALLSALSDDEIEDDTPDAAAAGLVVIGAPILDAVDALARDNFRYTSDSSARARLLGVLQRINGPRAKALATRLAAVVASETTRPKER